MIANNFETIQKILEIKSQPLTKENLLHVHRLVTTNTLSISHEEGALRETDDINVIDTTDGSIVHRPPDKAELDDLLADLFKFFNEEDPNLFIHPIVKACIIHFMYLMI
jgi:Fic family protein